MKTSILTLLLFASIATYGQNAPTSKSNGGNKPRFTCQRMEVTADKKKMTLRENVKLETNNLSLSADSVVIDNENQTLVAYGTKELTFSGGETVISKNPKNIVRYNLNDKTIFIE